MKKGLYTGSFWKFIQDFRKEYGERPTIGFLSGHFKVTTRAVHNELDLLEEVGLVERLKGVKGSERFMDYKIK